MQARNRFFKPQREQQSQPARLPTYDELLMEIKAQNYNPIALRQEQLKEIDKIYALLGDELRFITNEKTLQKDSAAVTQAKLDKCIAERVQICKLRMQVSDEIKYLEKTSAKKKVRS